MKWPNWKHIMAQPMAASTRRPIAVLPAPPCALGLVGKLPSAADFVRVLPADSSGAALDAWLVQAVELLQTMGGPNALGSVAFGFAVPARARMLLGLLEPSRDSRGRAFPVAVFGECSAAAWRAQPAKLWLAAEPLRQVARTHLAGLGGDSVADLERALNELPELATRDVHDSAARASIMTRTFLQRTLGATLPGSMFYALGTLAAAFSEPATPGGIVLECPVHDEADAVGWLELAGQLCAHADHALSAFQTTRRSRLLLASGPPMPELLRVIAEPSYEHPRIWPLTTNDSQAWTRAQTRLSGALPELLRGDRDLDLCALGKRLAQVSGAA